MDRKLMQIHSTSDIQWLYSDTSPLAIKYTGNNLSSAIDSLVFNNSLQYGTNFTITSKENTILVRLKKGSQWIDNSNQATFPTPLSLLSVQSYALLHLGVDIALIFERPTIIRSKQLIQPNEISFFIDGNGFRPEPTSNVEPFVGLKFSDPCPLTQGLDFSARALSNTRILVTLKADRVWRRTAGPLAVTYLNTVAAEKERLWNWGPVLVAMVEAQRPGSGCENSCKFARDGFCDEILLCATGTDCQDCGPPSSRNHTNIKPDDDDYWSFTDLNILRVKESERTKPIHLRQQNNSNYTLSPFYLLLVVVIGVILLFCFKRFLKKNYNHYQ